MTLAFTLSLAPLQYPMVAFALAFAVVVAAAVAAAAVAASAVVVLAQGFDTVINAVVGFSLNFPRYQPFRIVFAVCLGGTVSTIRQGFYAGTTNGFAVGPCLWQTVFVDVKADNVGDADDVS